MKQNQFFFSLSPFLFQFELFCWFHLTTLQVARALMMITIKLTCEGLILITSHLSLTVNDLLMKQTLEMTIICIDLDRR